MKFRFWGRPYWAIDYPLAERNFLPALRETTIIEVADDSRHLEITDDRIFQYPFLFMQQPGLGNWNPTAVEAERMREYLLRGGFMMVDDFHGTSEWDRWESQIKKVFPDRPMEEIPMDHPVFHCYYDFDKYPQIPGTRAIFSGRMYERDGKVPHCRGIFDDQRRLMVLINWNTDIGDGWEEAASYYYQREWAETAYRLGVNYAVYSMTH